MSGKRNYEGKWSKVYNDVLYRLSYEFKWDQSAQSCDFFTRKIPYLLWTWTDGELVERRVEIGKAGETKEERGSEMKGVVVMMGCGN